MFVIKLELVAPVGFHEKLAVVKVEVPVKVAVFTAQVMVWLGPAEAPGKLVFWLTAITEVLIQPLLVSVMVKV